MAKLPADSLVRGYVSTQKLAELAGLAALGGAGGSGAAAQTQALAKTLDSIDSLSFAAWANGNGYRLTLRSTLKQGADQSPLAMAPSSLTGLVPGDAFAFLAFGDYGSYLKQGLQSGAPGLGQQLKLLQQQTGISVQHDLLPLLSGDGLFYTAPGVPVRAALVLKPDDPHAAALTMHKIMTLVAQEQPGARVTPLASGTGEQVDLGGLALSWRLTADGLLAIGNDPAAGSAPSSPLASSPAYANLLNQAQVPDGANVPLYLNLSDALKLFPISVDPEPGPRGRGAGLEQPQRPGHLGRPVHTGEVAPLRRQIAAALPGRKEPNTSRRAPQTSPSVASTATAATIGGIRSPVPAAVSASAASAASTAA